jgi:hypothetical protein
MTSNKKYESDESEDNEIGGINNKHWDIKMYTEFCFENLRGMKHLDGMCVDVNDIKIDNKKNRVFVG